MMGVVPPGGKQSPETAPWNVEIYSDKKLITMTGNVISNVPIRHDQQFLQ